MHGIICIHYPSSISLVEETGRKRWNREREEREERQEGREKERKERGKKVRGGKSWKRKETEISSDR